MVTHVVEATTKVLIEVLGCLPRVMDLSLRNCGLGNARGVVKSLRSSMPGLQKLSLDGNKSDICGKAMFWRS